MDSSPTSPDIAPGHRAQSGSTPSGRKPRAPLALRITAIISGLVLAVAVVLSIMAMTATEGWRSIGFVAILAWGLALMFVLWTGLWWIAEVVGRRKDQERRAQSTT
ncbi:hypothetical protein [Brevibacterium otitidis]|uniref:Uncharacterized protein n=1 Tax=Brevibacterium otitidis TaxID=53364 RepID=A0ABV5X1J5_9MICO|nr:hypothetical protein GCM10023233_00050 [Brevibacterium otitidis]BFF08571.1 hypothetical protein GCM10023233_35400 [Brevibacterium otitidis]